MVAWRIVEPTATGHHLYYVRLLAEHLTGQDVEWVTTPSAERSDEATVHLQSALADRGLRCRPLEDWSSRGRVLRRAGGDVLVLPDGDAWLAAVAWDCLRRPGRRQPSVRLLLMRPPPRVFEASGLRDACRQTVKRAAAVTLTAVARLTGRQVALVALVDPFGARRGDVPRWAQGAADPVAPRRPPARGQSRAALGLDAQALVVGLLGAVDSRKNPGLVARGCAQAFRSTPGVLLVAGRVSPAARAELAGAGLADSELVVLDRYLSEAELAGAASCCDALAVLYTNHQSSSGVLALAAQVGAAAMVPRGSVLAAVAGAGGFGVQTELSVGGVASAVAAVRSDGARLGGAAAAAASRLGVEDFVTRLAGPP